MSKLNHTKGPWVTKQPTDDSHVLDVYGASGTIVAKGFWGGKADSRLIAAAPELLASVIRMQVELQNVLDGEIQPGAIEFEINKALEAIAKAKGA